MPVSISSPRFSLKESKKPSVCLKMLIPLNGSEIDGGWGVVAAGKSVWRGREVVRGSIRHTTDMGGVWRERD